MGLPVLHERSLGVRKLKTTVIIFFSAIKLLDADIYCVSDADGEDPPSVLPEFISAIESGYQIAVGLRKKRYENPFLSYFRKFLYRLGRAVADGPFNVDVGDFSAFTLNVRNYIIQQKNSHPLIRLSLAQTGFKSKKIEHDRMPRISGSSKFPPLKLFNFSMKHGLSVTTLPLRMAFYSLPFFATNFFIVSYLSVTSNLRIDYLILNVFLILLWVTVILSFIAIYVARIYKNGLEMPNSFIDFDDSIL
jgi:dolichol-phosphate mannosyltransferase